MEGWLRGRRHRTRNAASGKLDRGFKSLPFRINKKHQDFLVFYLSLKTEGFEGDPSAIGSSEGARL